jgi:hypothetical protein
MRSIFALLLIGACLATPCSFAQERFTSDKPTPLKRLDPGPEDGNGARFGGSVQLTGQFLMVSKRENSKRVYEQITFYPDAGSAALLPHPVDEKAVTELIFTNREQASAMLRDLVAVEKPLPRGESGSAGTATVTIKNYRTEVECDHRWYLADLVAAKKNRDLIVSARKAGHGCDG